MNCVYFCVNRLIPSMPPNFKVNTAMLLVAIMKLALAAVKLLSLEDDDDNDDLSQPSIVRIA